MDPATALQALAASPLDQPYPITSRPVGSFQIVDYTPKAILVTGETKPICDQLKRLGGRFNWFEVDKGSGTRVPGFVFPKTRVGDVERFLLSIGPMPRQTSPYAAAAAAGQAVPFGLPVVVAKPPEVALAEATEAFVKVIMEHRGGALRHVQPLRTGAHVVLRGTPSEIENLLEAELTLDPTTRVEMRAQLNDTVILLLTRAQEDPQLD